jgi:hypothetical protein
MLPLLLLLSTTTPPRRVGAHHRSYVSLLSARCAREPLARSPPGGDQRAHSRRTRELQEHSAQVRGAHGRLLFTKQGALALVLRPQSPSVRACARCPPRERVEQLQQQRRVEATERICAFFSLVDPKPREKRGSRGRGPSRASALLRRSCTLDHGRALSFCRDQLARAVVLRCPLPSRKRKRVAR